MNNIAVSKSIRYGFLTGICFLIAVFYLYKITQVHKGTQIVLKKSNGNNGYKTTGLRVKSKVAGPPTKLSGAAFDGLREIVLETTVTVSLIHSFSPYTENRFRSMMIDPVRDEHPIFANSPAILQTEDGNLITVMRIWLEKEYWEINKKHSHNTFSDNYFYLQVFDDAMNPITPGRVLGIPTPTQWSIGDGPIEPRIFTVNGTIYLTFNTGITKEDNHIIDSTFFWDLSNDKGMIPVISDGQPMLDQSKDKMPRDKHWSAIVDGNQLYFAYNLDPLRILQCDMNGGMPTCHFIHKEGPDDYSFDNRRDSLRGGTPFIVYKHPYYISIAHGTFFRRCPNNTKCDWKRYYSSHLVVLRIKPDFRVCYVSENIPYPKESLRVPIVRSSYIKDPFVFPVGLLLENEDSIVVGGHINDYSSALFRITGVKSLMDQLVLSEEEFPRVRGPPFSTLQKYMKTTAEKATGYTFYDT